LAQHWISVGHNCFLTWVFNPGATPFREREVFAVGGANMASAYCWKAETCQINLCFVFCVWFWDCVRRKYQWLTPKRADLKKF